MAKSAQLARLEARLDAIPKEVKRAVQPALEKSSRELVDRMKQLVPVDTGDLRDSIVMTPAGQRTPPYSMEGSRVAKENEILVTAGNSKVRYGHLVEFGTIKTPAQPFFFVSLRLNRKRATNRIKRAVSKAVREHWGSK